MEPLASGREGDEIPDAEAVIAEYAATVLQDDPTDPYAIESEPDFDEEDEEEEDEEYEEEEDQEYEEYDEEDEDEEDPEI